MISAPSAIGAVVGRIQTIEQRFAPERPPTVSVVPSRTAFDPFGEAYQRALAARPLSPSASASFATNDLGRARWVAQGGPGATATGATPPRGSIGGYGPMPVPSDLAAFGNGRIPADRLSPIRQSGHRLYAPAAAAWDRLVDAAAADGFDLRITDSYRSYENQVDLARRKGLYSEGGLAARPGTSNHGWGLAVDADVTDPALLEWIRRRGPEFGWVEAVPREPWHWEYRPHQIPAA